MTVLLCTQEWKACKSSIENKRGYTCGLWLLFHSLAGRIEPTDSGGALWMTAIKYAHCSWVLSVKAGKALCSI